MRIWSESRRIWALHPSWSCSTTPEPAFLREGARLVVPSSFGTFSGEDRVSARDLDGDSDIDVLLLSDSGLRTLRNLGAGVYSDDTTGAPLGAGLRDQDLADVDNDGDLDAVLGTSSTFNPEFILARNDGLGNFDEATDFLSPAVTSTPLAARFLDLEGDGDADLVTAEGDLLENDGSGVFAPAAGGIDCFRVPRVVDLDLDGDDDIVASAPALFSAVMTSTWRNNGEGAFEKSSDLFGAQTFVIADWSGDGFPDLIYQDDIFGTPALNLSFAIGGSDGTFSLAPPRPSGFVAVGLAGEYAAADFDGDGDQDVFADSDARDLMYWNRGAGDFTAAVVTPESPTSIWSGPLELADADGDGDLDAFTITGATVSWVENLRDGRFASSAGLTPGNAFGLLDLGQDGDVDVLAIGNGLTLAENLGGGTFQDGVSKLPSFTNPPTASEARFRLGDLDGDGLEDVLIFKEPSTLMSRNLLLLQDATGALVDESARIAPSGLLNDVNGALGDTDGDGDLDLVAPGFSSFLNNGDGSFTPPPPFSNFGTPSFESDWRLVDVDENGVLDLVATLPARLGVHRGLGAGNFSNLLAGSAPRSDVTGDEVLVVADIDGDGRSDYFTNEQDLFLSRGGFVIESLSSALPGLTGFRPEGAAVGDIDLDGDVDLWVGGHTQIHWNLQRQLAWRTWPRIGKGLVLELFGTPGGLWGLWGSLATANVPTPPYGLLRLDLAQGARVGVGFLDSQGRAQDTVAIPDDSSLIGVEVFWQAAIGTPVRLSNLQVTVLDDL